MLRVTLVFLSIFGYIAKTSLATADDVTITVLSATVKDKAIADAKVMFQQIGRNSTSYTTTTNSRGEVKATLPFSDDDNVLLIVERRGYSALVVKCPCNGLTYAMSEPMTQLDGMRIVLTWGRHPLDLDAHLAYENNHVYFAHRNADGAELDVDNRTGYGPETITINRMLPGESYLYGVHTFYDADEATAASDVSRAVVQVYVGSSVIQTLYFVPPKVDYMNFIFSVDALGGIHPFPPNYTVSAHGERGAANALASALEMPIKREATVGPVARNKQRAIERNRDGERAYRRGDLDAAISSYRDAIEFDGEYSQAYSNLGLAYQKNGQVAEAIWANRKAISLASGVDTNTVRANSYYNIARIYESHEEWDSALRNYEYANDNRSLPAYDTAIRRMKQRLKASR